MTGPGENRRLLLPITTISGIFELLPGNFFGRKGHGNQVLTEFMGKEGSFGATKSKADLRRLNNYH